MNGTGDEEVHSEQAERARQAEGAKQAERAGRAEPQSSGDRTAGDLTADEAPRPEAGDGDRRRLLSQPPSARYASSEPPSGRKASDRTMADARMTVGQALALGSVVGAIGVVVLAVLASVLGLTAGLVVVALFVGRLVGLVMRSAATGGAVSSPIRRRPRPLSAIPPVLSSDQRTLVAIVIMLVGLTAAQVGIWLLALREGGVLPLPDFLAQAYGPIVPLEFMVGTVTAWWSAR